MDYTRLTDTELSEFLTNLVVRLRGHEIDCLTDDVADRLADELEPLSAEFDEDIVKCVEVTALRQSLFAAKKDRRTRILAGVSGAKQHMRASGGGPADFAKCNLTFRDKWSRVTAETPSDLTVTAMPNGVHKIRFSGNNGPKRVTYEVWRRDGKGTQWDMIGTTTRQSHSDEDVRPGKYYEYRVRAVSVNDTSAWSNTAVKGGA